MDIAREDLFALIDQTWQTLFGDAVVECEPDATIVWALRSTVRIQGAWNGGVAIDFEQETAERVAAGMLDAKPGELSVDEIRDAIGEIANILAGNVKPMLPQPSTLGLPEIHERGVGASPESGRNEPLSLNCVWGASRFSVMIVGTAGADGA